MESKAKRILCIVVSRIFGAAAGFLLFLMLFGCILARHVDNTQEVLGRVWLFTRFFGVCCLGAAAWGNVCRSLQKLRGG